MHSLYKAITCVWKIVTYMVVEKGCGKRVSFDGTMMQALELLWLVERLVSGGSDVEHYVRQQVSHLVQG